MTKKVKIITTSILGGVLAVFLIVAIVLSSVFTAGKTAFDKGWDNADYSQEQLAAMLAAKPSERQLAFDELGYYAFFHFGINTFTGNEWGNGKENLDLFNPTELDTDQWVKAVVDSGAKAAIITAKHHDGFCLWPSAYTEHDIANTPYKNGQGDIVADFAASCKKFGIKFGVYLSPWDMNAESYGEGVAYDDYYVNQLEELLTNYGEVFEVWFDGAPSDEDRLAHGQTKKQNYDFDRYFAKVHELQPNACTAIKGTDVRWVGNEDGLASDEEWSVRYDKEKGYYWYPAECDVSIRSGWFWHKNQSPKSLSHLMKIYYSSVGKNASLLLNIPPNDKGLVDEKDIKRLKEFGEAINEIYKNQVDYQVRFGGGELLNDSETLFTGENALQKDDKTSYTMTENQYIIDIKLDKKTALKHIVLSEDITQSQRVESYKVYAKNGSDYIRIYEGKVIGSKRIIKLNDFITPRTDNIKIVIEKSRSNPVLRYIGLYA